MSSNSNDTNRPINAGLVEAAIRRHVDHRANVLIPEATIRSTTGAEYRADFIMVSKASFATELEVKISIGDWRKDLSKPKWVSMPDWITRFIYVVPEQLGMPAWVPAQAGIWHVKAARVDHFSTQPDGYEIVVARAPHVLGRQKVSEAVVARWHRNLYYRYWEQRIDAQRRIPRHMREGVV